MAGYKRFRSGGWSLTVYAGTKGHLDKIPVERVAEWERDFLAYLKEQKPEVRQQLVDQAHNKGALKDNAEDLAAAEAKLAGNSDDEKLKAKVDSLRSCERLRLDLEAAISRFQDQFASKYDDVDGASEPAAATA